jgi:phage tail-like protein
MIRTTLRTSAVLVLLAISAAQAVEPARTRTGELGVGLRIIDPYTAYRFRIVMDGRDVAAVSTADGLEAVSVVSRSGTLSQPAAQRPRSRQRFAAVMLESGLTHDAGFEQWLKEGKAGAREVGVVAYDDAGKIVQSYTLHHSWASEYQAPAGLIGGVLTIQHVKLENEGWDVGSR